MLQNKKEINQEKMMKEIEQLTQKVDELSKENDTLNKAKKAIEIKLEELNRA